MLWVVLLDAGAEKVEEGTVVEFPTCGEKERVRVSFWLDPTGNLE